MQQPTQTPARERVGYRLNYAELFNWGTFTNRVYRIAPEGGTTLMTGANGSGKTTFIEALLTLLVPEKRMRFYNRASGTNQRDERTEESYVLGVFGNTIDEQNSRQTERLREKDTYSVLLAVFGNENQSVTLAQVRSFKNGELKRTYLMAHLPLTIANDFDLGDMSTDWKKALRQKYPKIGNRDLIEFFDGPGHYATAFQHVFGMRSPKALTLFSQTVGLKVLGDLNDFVRNNMLEDSDMEGEFTQLKANMDKLIQAHTGLEKVETQVGMLEPICAETDRLDTLRQQRDGFLALQEIRPAYAARRKVTLCAEAATAQRRQADLCETSRQLVEVELVNLRDQFGTIDYAIRTDEVGEQLRELKKLAKQATTDWHSRQERADQYDALCRAVGLTKSVADSNNFDKRVTYLKQRAQTLESEIDALIGEESATKTALATAKTAHETTAADLREARQQQNNIPVAQRRIRDALLTYLNATEDELPFVGELLEVQTDERAVWQPAIEKLLRPFALCLLVPEPLRRTVNAYVKDANLKGKLVFFPVDVRKNFTSKHFGNQFDTVRNKVNIKGIDADESDYGGWIEQQMEERYSYRCVDTLDDFYTTGKALTKEGFIRNENRHEKDDRTDNRQGFVLGWDNKSLIRQYETLLDQLDGQIRTAQTQLTALSGSLKQKKAERGTLIDLLRFETFAELDWQSKAIEALDLQRRQQDLEETNDRVRELEKQLDAVKQRIAEADKQRGDLERKVGVFNNKALEYDQKQQEAVELLALFAHVDEPAPWQAFEQYVAEQNVPGWTAETVDADERKLTETLTNQQREADTAHNAQVRKLEKLLTAFLTPADAIRQRFPTWSDDLGDLGPDAKYAPEYVALLDRLKRQELGQLRKRFKNFMDENMIVSMSDFKEQLYGNVNGYETNIGALNDALRQITYSENPQTFIQLNYEDEWAVKIREFKQKLNGWAPNYTDYERTRDERILETSFLKIKALIDELDQNKDFRREVTDARNWLRFRATEYLGDGTAKPVRVYETTGSLSGGEKAQLTYTILGSAIAYQFGIGEANTPDAGRSGLFASMSLSAIRTM